jgi:hypothetical protein
MTTRWYVAAVAAILLLPAGSAHAAGLDPQGAKCAFNSTIDVTTEDGYQIGDLRFGPLALSEPGVVRCVFYVDGSPGLTVETHTSGTGAVEVAAGAQPIRYAATAADVVDLCTVVRYDSGATMWWQPNLWTGAPGRWRTDPVEPYDCGPRIEIPEGFECSVWKAVDNRAGTPLAKIWQDCEPYEPII